MTDAPRSLVERLRELSGWLSEHNIDIQMPVGMIDPDVAADRIDALEREVAGLTAQLKAAGDMLEALGGRMKSVLGVVSKLETQLTLARAQVREQAAKVAETIGPEIETGSPAWKDGRADAKRRSAAAIRAMPLEG